jgi:DNA-binding CsgD family transcriptional regulator
MRSQPSRPPDGSATEPVTSGRTGPGVLIFTRLLQLEYLNREAHRLLKLAAQAHGLPATGALFPPELNAMLKDIVERFRHYRVPKDWEEVDLTQTLDRGSVVIMLRGFGLPDPRDMRHSRILLLMEEASRPRVGVPVQAKDHFQLTEREQTVVEHLCKGLTNKQIAATLGVSPATVKEHVRSLMKKTKTSTRTAIMGEILSLAG